jgi:hypothetical protein
MNHAVDIVVDFVDTLYTSVLRFHMVFPPETAKLSTSSHQLSTARQTPSCWLRSPSYLDVQVLLDKEGCIE